MKFLLDSNVLSEWTRLRPDPGVCDWFQENLPEFCIPPVVLGELQYGVLILPSSRRQRELRAWIEDVARTICVIEFNAADALVWAQLLARLKRRGTPMPVADSLIAASALSRGLTLVTRNENHFKKTGVSLLNPFTKT
jgi:predicted nucleic acid-binding protein